MTELAWKMTTDLNLCLELEINVGGWASYLLHFSLSLSFRLWYCISLSLALSLSLTHTHTSTVSFPDNRYRTRHSPRWSPTCSPPTATWNSLTVLKGAGELLRILGFSLKLLRLIFAHTH